MADIMPPTPPCRSTSLFPLIPLSPIARLAVCLLVTLTILPANASALPVGGTASVITSRPPDARAIDANDPRYGLIGDGIHDDTLALASAIAATYASGTPDCTHPGARVVLLRGDGRVYRLSNTVSLPIESRIVGYGATRPVLLLGAATPGFSDAGNLIPMLKVVNNAPDPTGVNASSRPCSADARDGGNTAFTTGVINVDMTIEPGNAGAVAIRNRAAQGGVLRAMTFTLAPDAAIAVQSPGWAHQELLFRGGRVGVMVNNTGAWPALFRDCTWEGQGAAAVAWAPFETSPWVGVTLLRARVSGTPVAIDASAGAAVRLTLLDSAFTNVSVLVALPAVIAPDASGAASSVVATNCGGAGVRTLLGASDAGPARANPAGDGAFALTRLVAGLVTPDVRAPGGAVPVVQVIVDAAPAARPPQLPPADTPAFPPTDQWVPVTAHGLVGDGLTDNTAALNALLAAPPPSRALYFPLGVYALRGTVTVPPQPRGSAPLLLFGLSCWDAVISLTDDAPLFKDPSAMRAMVHVQGGGADNGGEVWLWGLNLRTAMTYAVPQPPPVPSGWANPNPGAIALLWEAQAGGIQDLFFHPATWPDNPRDGTGPNTEFSLVVRNGGAGVFADTWSCNSYAQGGVRVLDTRGPVTFSQLSSEHHAGHELWVTNATGVVVHVMQTEDRSPDAAPTSSVLAESGSNVAVSGLFSYYAAKVSSAGAIIVDATSAVTVSVQRQYHSYHPLFYNCTLLALGPAGESAACVTSVDFAFAAAAPVTAFPAVDATPGSGDDISVLRARLLTSFCWIPGTNLSALATASLRYAHTLLPSKQWPDVNYTDPHDRAVWKTSEHLSRVADMARAVSTPGSPAANSSAITTAIREALAWWLEVDPQNDNWCVYAVPHQITLFAARVLTHSVPQSNIPLPPVSLLTLPSLPPGGSILSGRLKRLRPFT